MRIDSRQSEYRALLQVLGLPADSTLEDIVTAAQKELDFPLRPRASQPSPDQNLRFSDALVTSGDNANKTPIAVEGQVFTNLTSLSIDYQARTVSNASYLDITFPASTVGQYRRVLFYLAKSGKITSNYSAEAASVGALANPGSLIPNAPCAPLGYVDLICTNASGSFKTANSATNIIESEDIYRINSQAGFQGSKSTDFTIVNNQVAAADITNLVFDGASIKSFVVEYSIYRNTTGGGATELSESGQLKGVFKPVADEWAMSQTFQGDDAGITLSITALGQIQYESTSITGTPDQSYIRYKVIELISQ